LLGVKAVIAASFERIHRSNLGNRSLWRLKKRTERNVRCQWSFGSIRQSRSIITATAGFCRLYCGNY